MYFILLYVSEKNSIRREYLCLFSISIAGIKICLSFSKNMRITAYKIDFFNTIPKFLVYNETSLKSDSCNHAQGWVLALCSGTNPGGIFKRPSTVVGSNQGWLCGRQTSYPGTISSPYSITFE